MPNLATLGNLPNLAILGISAVGTDAPADATALTAREVVSRLDLRYLPNLATFEHLPNLAIPSIVVDLTDEVTPSSCSVAPPPIPCDLPNLVTLLHFPEKATLGSTVLPADPAQSCRRLVLCLLEQRQPEVQTLRLKGGCRNSSAAAASVETRARLATWLQPLLCYYIDQGYHLSEHYWPCHLNVYNSLVVPDDLCHDFGYWMKVVNHTVTAILANYYQLSSQSKRWLNVLMHKGLHGSGCTQAGLTEEAYRRIGIILLYAGWHHVQPSMRSITIRSGGTKFERDLGHWALLDVPCAVMDSPATIYFLQDQKFVEIPTGQICGHASLSLMASGSTQERRDVGAYQLRPYYTALETWIYFTAYGRERKRGNLDEAAFKHALATAVRTIMLTDLELQPVLANLAPADTVGAIVPLDGLRHAAGGFLHASPTRRLSSRSADQPPDSPAHSDQTDSSILSDAGRLVLEFGDTRSSPRRSRKEPSETIFYQDWLRPSSRSRITSSSEGEPDKVVDPDAEVRELRDVVAGAQCLVGHMRDQAEHHHTLLQ